MCIVQRQISSHKPCSEVDCVQISIYGHIHGFVVMVPLGDVNPPEPFPTECVRTVRLQAQALQRCGLCTDLHIWAYKRDKETDLHIWA